MVRTESQPREGVPIMEGYVLLPSFPEDQVLVHRLFTKGDQQLNIEAFETVLQRGKITSKRVVPAGELDQHSKEELMRFEIGVLSLGLNCSRVGSSPEQDMVFSFRDGFFFFFTEDQHDERIRVCVKDGQYPMLVTELAESTGKIGGCDVAVENTRIALTLNQVSQRFISALEQTLGLEWFRTHALFLPPFKGNKVVADLFRKLLRGESIEEISDISLFAYMAEERYLTQTLSDSEHFESLISNMRRAGEEVVLRLSNNFTLRMRLLAENRLVSEAVRTVVEEIKEGWKRMLEIVLRGCSQINDFVYVSPNGYIVIYEAALNENRVIMLPCDPGTEAKIVEEKDVLNREENLEYIFQGEAKTYSLLEF